MIVDRGNGPERYEAALVRAGVQFVIRVNGADVVIHGIEAEHADGSRASWPAEGLITPLEHGTVTVGSDGSTEFRYE